MALRDYIGLASVLLITAFAAGSLAWAYVLEERAKRAHYRRRQVTA